MNFSFTEEQTLLQDSLMRFVQKEYSFEKRLGIQCLEQKLPNGRIIINNEKFASGYLHALSLHYSPIASPRLEMTFTILLTILL